MGNNAARIALAVCFGILLVIGILAIAGGVYLATTSDEHRKDARAELQAQTISGQYVDPITERTTKQIGDIEAHDQSSKGLKSVVVGVVLTIPFLVLWAYSNARKTPRL